MHIKIGISRSSRNMADFFASFFFLFAVIDPICSAPVFLEATKDFGAEEKRKIAIRACVVAFLILLFFIVVGQLIFEGMEVTLDAF